MEARKQQTHVSSNNAQKLLLKRCAGIVVVNGDTRPTQSFSTKASLFRELKKQGLNYIQIDEILRRN